MRADGLDREEAEAKLEEIRTFIIKYDHILQLPYSVGTGTALLCGFIAVPMVFDWEIAVWFNQHYVTMDLPAPQDRETMLEVGAWTWNYMEPVIGTASFVLLALEVARTRMLNAGFRPYTFLVRETRAERVSKAYPRYEARLIIDYSMCLWKTYGGSR